MNRRSKKHFCHKCGHSVVHRTYEAGILEITACRLLRKPRTLPEFLSWYWKRLSAPRARSAVRLIFELYALALRNPREYPGVLEDPLAYWQKLTEKTGVPSKLDGVEATLLLAATRGLLLDLCATGDRARVERAMEALAQFVEWRVTPTEIMGRKPKELNGR